MKKTLALIALLGFMAVGTLHAENTTIWSTGINPKDSSTYYTSYKHNPSYGWDHNMCWAVSASNVIAWWQDQVEQSGAYILPADCPTGYDVWEKVRLMWQDNSGYAVRVMQHWLSGDRSGSNDLKFTEAGLAFTGYFNHLLGADYPFDSSERSSYCMTTSIYANAKTANNTYDVAVPQIVQLVKDGWGLVLGSENHAMTIYGIEVDENDDLKRVYYNDNNYPYQGKGYMTSTSIRKGGENNFGYNGIMADQLGYGNDIEIVYAMRTTGMRFDTYEATAGADNTADVFSHFLNLTVDGATDYKLQYDLRVAGSDCPVDTNGNDVGNIDLLNGKITLVKGVGEYDGGGAAEGTITFGKASDDSGSRTLVVDHTATIAAEIKINAAEGNTLQVTDGNTATFGKLTGTGNLDKTGAGDAKVTDEVTLVGAINVHEGGFIFGKDVVLTEDTELTVDAGGRVSETADKSITLTLSSGIHENNGVMSLTTTLTGGTLKGSGTFGAVTVDGGTLVVGNSPGHQEYEGALTLNSGSIEFAVDGFESANDGSSTGWDSGTYSTINMNGHDLVLNEDGQIVISLSSGAAQSLTMGSGEISLALVTGLASAPDLDLATLASMTSFELVDELPEALAAAAPSSLLQNVSYAFDNNSLVLHASYGAGGAVPEPTTGTLSLLALAALAARRRRK